MNKIKTVKIKNEDGSVDQEAFHISADARNIDMTNGYNVQETIGTIDINEDGNIAEQLNKLNIDIKKKAYYFDTVANMKNANLQAGDYAITLGYYNANDGGAGKYQIIDGDYNDDGGIIHELNNGLYAQLIIENEINIKQFGAKGDSINDDTLIIQKAIDYCRTKILLTDIANINTIVFPAGKYKITRTVIVSPFVKIKTVGYTALLSYVENGPCLWFSPSADDFGNSIGNKQDWFRGPWLNGEAGLIIKNMLEVNSGTIGIEIGTRTNLGELKCCARYSMNDFRIYNFNIAIQQNCYNNYIATLNRVSVESNSIGLNFGPNNIVPENAGEKFFFEDCLFANNAIAVQWQTPGMSTFFHNCSFDFCKCIFYDANQRGWHHIQVSQSHIEGFGILNPTSDDIYGILYGTLKESSVTINECEIYNSKNCKMFTRKNSENVSNYYLSFYDNKMLFVSKSISSENEFLADNVYVPTFFINNKGHENKNKIWNNITNLCPQSSFNDLELGDFVIPASNTIGTWTINYKEGINANTGLEIVEDSPIAEKALKIKSTASVRALHLKSDFIPVLPNRYIMGKIMAKNYNNNLPILFEFYDNNKNLISSSSSYVYFPAEDRQEDVWNNVYAAKEVRTPRNCYYVKIVTQPTFKANKDGYIGGIFVQYI